MSHDLKQEVARLTDLRKMLVILVSALLALSPKFRYMGGPARNLSKHSISAEDNTHRYC